MSRRNATRGRRVEFLARDRLRDRGFCVIMSTGSRTPVDLIAGKHREVVFVQTRRLRRPVSDVHAVAARFRNDIVRLQGVYRRAELPVQLWIYTDQEGWRFFTVHAGGVAEVSGDDA